MSGDTGTKEFCYDLDGLNFTIMATTNPDGTIRLTVSVTEGAADINAIYWGDEDQSGESFSLGKSLNLNGLDQQWDGGIKLSDPGLKGEEKDTYLTEGESFSFDLPPGVSLEDLESIGVRATSTTTDEGSIKAVANCEPEDDEEEDEWPADVMKVIFHYDTDEDTEPDLDVLITDWGDEEPRDFTEYVDAARAHIASEYPDLDPYTALVGLTVIDDYGNITEFEVSPEDGTQPTTESGEEFMASLSTGMLDEDAPVEDMIEEDQAIIL